MYNKNSAIFKLADKVDLKRCKLLCGKTIEPMYRKIDQGLEPIQPQVIKAVCKLAEIMTDKSAGGVGTYEAQNGQTGYCGEIVDSGDRYCVAINPSSFSRTYQILVSKGASGTYNLGPRHSEDGAVILTMILFKERIQKKSMDLFNSMTEIFKGLKDLPQAQGDKVPDSLANNFARLSSWMLRKLYHPDDFEYSIFDESGNIEKITPYAIKKGKYAPTNVLAGEFKLLADMEAPKKPVKTSAKQHALPKKKFGHPYTEEEQKLIPEIPDWYVVPKEVGVITKMIQMTTGSNHPMRNFMFRGPSSTGKSSLAKAIAATLHMPYTFVTCAADTESYLFFGQPMYDKDGKVKYVESDFIRAIKNGYLVEVQEPYVIAKQGVLTSLNGLLDDGQATTLSTGEIVRRHPDSIVIFTTNVDYVACKRPNQSVLRRMDAIFDIEQPSDKIICERVASVTGFDNMAILKKMAVVRKKINKYLQKEELADGVCGVTELIDWVEAFMTTGDIFTSAEFTIVSKATDNLDAQQAISAFVEAEFDPNTKINTGADNPLYY